MIHWVRDDVLRVRLDAGISYSDVPQRDAYRRKQKKRTAGGSEVLTRSYSSRALIDV